MLLAKVVGTVVATRKTPASRGSQFLLLRQVNPENLKEGRLRRRQRRGRLRSRRVRPLRVRLLRAPDRDDEGPPCDAVVMAIVDTWEIGGQQLYEKHSSEHGYADERP
jgi:microcompartment protein CcmK/EutM